MQSVITPRSRFRSGWRRLAFSLRPPLWLAVAMACMKSRAVDLSQGEVQARLDTTVSAGASRRMEDRDEDLIGVMNGGKANSINSDDGNLNYEQGDLVSESARVTHELDLRWRNYSFFGRMFYFYDRVIMHEQTDRTPLSDIAETDAGADVEYLDAYVTGDFNLLDRAVSLRAGNQVLSWGESTFIQNGINAINPVNVAQLRVAGAELREALKPVPMVSASADLFENLSIEGFYQIEWENTEVEPDGTFFSTSDLASPGGRYVFLGFGQPPGTDNPPLPVGSDPPVGTWVPRGPDREPDDAGQGGAALRYFSPELNDTEFGVYYIRYHSRMPLLSGRAGAPAPKVKKLMDLIPFVQWGLESGDYASTSSYFREFPEDIDLYGLSFNTSAKSIGLAIQGEVSYRQNQPLQVDDVELLFSALSPLDPSIHTLLILENLLEQHRLTDPPYPIFGRSQLGAVGFGEEIPGYRRKEVVQPQMTLTKMLGPAMGGTQTVLIGEGGATWIPDLEDPDELRYEGPGTFTSGNEFFTKVGVQPATQPRGFADDFSWGYRVASRFDYNNVIGAMNLHPSIAFSHDVGGTTPAPLSNFVNNRKAVTLSLGTSYLNRTRAAVSYTTYFGAGEYNLLSDRDFISLTASYSF